jgi:hypothetical protein
MSHPEETDRTVANPDARLAKKPYHKPEFRFEPVFETRALTCGKVSPTQSSCLHNRKSS